MILALVIGFLFGFIGSIPVAGPIAILVLERGLTRRFHSGLATAVGAAMAESAYAFLAFFGLSALLARHPGVIPVSRAVAAVILLALGTVLVRRRPRRPPLGELREAPAAAGSQALVGFMITALNPTLIATWTTAVTALYASGLFAPRPARALPFAVGVCAGIITWFALLLGLVRRFGGRIRWGTVDRVVRALGVGLVGIGVWFAVISLRYYL